MSALRYIFITTVSFSIIAQALANSCPVDAASGCRCVNGPPNKGRVIDCLDAGLYTIPKFTESSEVFYKITFTNSFDPATSPSSTCVGCNKITSIPANAFKGIKMQVLDLSRNPLGVISSYAFNGLETVLSEIILEGNKILPPPYLALARLRNLRSLSLRYFKQQFISRQNTNLENLAKLETLKYINMDIEYMQNDAFQSRLPNLKRLELEYLPMKNFPVAALQPLRNLTYLSAVYLDIRDIQSGSFSGFKNLEELVLSHNNLRTLGRGCFSGIEGTLKKLGLQLNNLDQNSIGYLGTLQWQRLEQLNLGHNALNVIPNGLFSNMRSLLYLYLDSNLLTTVDVDAFRGLDSLIFMDLSYNQLDTIAPGAFLDTPTLREIDLRGENTRILSKSFLLSSASVEGLGSSLQKLVLTDTIVNESAVWDAVKFLPNLIILELGGTGVKEIPDFQFVNNKYLKYLMLEKNDISVVNDAKIYGLEDNLVNLNLQNNKIQVLDRCTLDMLTKLEMLYLGGNPLACTCEAIPLHDWISEQSKLYPLLPYVVNSVCESPAEVKNKRLQSLNKNELKCSPTYVEKSCRNFTNLFTTASATSPSVFSTSKPTITTRTRKVPFTFVKITESENSVQFLWEVEDSNKIAGYTLDHQKLGSFQFQSIRIPRSALSFELNGLEKSSVYLFCLSVTYTDSKEKPIRPCIVVNTI